ncbi:MAG: hypothetical protein IPO73_02120 [Gemmatimonadetes bacterium]|nr:hypothetical protein [Gemmatimonadota bacterium]MBK9690478.1 hypothetical protein [Gemmatimonadota bacterium]
MTTPLVIKLGGDALASPERIAAEAHRIAGHAARGPVVAVASARRGVTDRLLGLADEVDTAARRLDGSAPPLPEDSAERDRVVATGEVVAASLLALALNRLGVAAVSLDAREAGVRASGRFGRARIRHIQPRRIQQILARGIVPVITGFQGWHRGRVATLARGGTDTSAIALAAALGGNRVRFVKDAEGLRTADPRLVPESRPIPEAPHAFLTALTAAGARIVQAEAAALAEERGVALEFCSLASDQPLSTVGSVGSVPGLCAVASTPAGEGVTAITALTADPRDVVLAAEALREALVAEGVLLLDRQPAAGGLRLLVNEAQATLALRVVHRVLVEGERRCSSPVRRAS